MRIALSKSRPLEPLRRLALLLLILGPFLPTFQSTNPVFAKGLEDAVVRTGNKKTRLKQIGGECTFSGGKVTFGDVKKIRSAKLYSITLENCELSSNVLSELMQKTIPSRFFARHCVLGEFANTGTTYRNLSYLELEDCGIRDDDLLFLKHCVNLKALSVLSNPIHGKFLSKLAAAKELERLILRDTLLRTENVSLIREFSQLKTLDLDQTPCQPGCVTDLEALRQLKQIRVPYHSDPDAWWISLRKTNNAFRNLATEDFYNCALSDQAWGIESTLTHKYLNLAGTKITDAGIGRTNFPNLKTLDLSKCRISGETLDANKLPVLEDLRLRRCSLTKDGIAVIGKNSRLASLDISESLPADRNRLVGLSSSKIQLLDLSRNPSLDAEDIRALIHCSDLRELRLDGVSIFPELVEALGLLCSLDSLSLNQCHGFDQRSLAHFSKLKRLRQLSVLHAELSEKQLQSLQDSLRNCNVISKPPKFSENWTTMDSLAQPNELP